MEEKINTEKIFYRQEIFALLSFAASMGYATEFCCQGTGDRTTWNSGFLSLALVEATEKVCRFLDLDERSWLR